MLSKTIKTKKELSVYLSKLKKYRKPKLELEQYFTDPELVSEILWFAYLNGDIENKIIADLGAGTGILGIGALLLGAKKVYFVEKDQEAVNILKENLNVIGLNNRFEIVVCDVLDFNTRVDIVISNPPFGIQSKELEKFLMKFFEIADIFYSIFHISKKSYILSIIENKNWKVCYMKDSVLVLDKTYWFHEKEKEGIPVFWIKACKFIYQ